MKKNSLLVWILIKLLRLYKLVISPYLTPSCRFDPTCSIYAMKSLQKYGLFKGLFLSIKRVLRCHPFCKGGYDPVP